MMQRTIISCIILVYSVCIKAQLSKQEVFTTLIELEESLTNDPSATIAVCDSIISYCEASRLDCQRALGLAQKCVALARQSKFEDAMQTIVEAQQIHDSAHCDQQILVYIYRAKSTVYHRMDDYHIADSLTLLAIRMFQPEWSNKAVLIRLHSNLGRVERGFHDARAHLDTSYQLAKTYGYPILQNQALINLGYIYANIDSLDAARRYWEQALKEAKYHGILDHIMKLYNNVAGFMDNNREKLIYLDSAIHYAILLNDVSSQQSFIQNKALVYSELGQYEKGYNELWHALTLKDTVLNAEKYKAIAEMQEKYDTEKKNTEIKTLKVEMENAELKQSRLEESRKRIFIGGSLMMGLAVLFGYGFMAIRRSRKQIAAEKERSEQLLLNILPIEIADELKTQGHATARKHDHVAILFTDFKEFTQISGQMSAVELVEQLNVCFRAFDEICKNFGIEKIKTIGDAYMAAGGLHAAVNGSVKNTVMAALEMQQFVATRKAERDAAHQSSFEMRAGVHTGPVVAGIVGDTKFQYDIWGDTVNIANRMEVNGVPGKVNISQDTYEQLKDDPDFLFESRGKIEAKGKGQMQMWFVTENQQMN